MNWIREIILNGDLLTGTFLNLGSTISCELAGNAGFDFMVIDMEHGSSDLDRLVNLTQAVAITPAASVVRIAWNEAPRFKRALDMGCEGIMVPMVNSADEARQAVRSMRYPPDGIRGVAGSIRPGGFGQRFDDYFRTANQKLTCMVQIESPEAVEAADDIAAVDGIDVLFIGPVDLTSNMGIYREFDHPRFTEACQKVVTACRKHHKAAGVLAVQPEQVAVYFETGFTCICLGTDGTTLARAFREQVSAFDPFR
jgi:2-keto-3-deoxy-L-rhamnonate aldolase RhmA